MTHFSANGTGACSQADPEPPCPGLCPGLSLPAECWTCPRREAGASVQRVLPRRLRRAAEGPADPTSAPPGRTPGAAAAPGSLSVLPATHRPVRDASVVGQKGPGELGEARPV